MGTGRWWGRRLRLLVFSVLGLLTASLLAGGCVRARVAVAVSPDDLVTGEIVVAVTVASEQEPGVALGAPEDLAGRVRAEPYRQDGYAGTRLLFSDLTFEEFGRLVLSATEAPEGLQFELRRAGSFVLLTGRVDLTGIPNPELADVQVRVSFPGSVTSTNGDLQDGTVAWLVEPGKVTELSATARYTEPGTRSWSQWAALVGAMAGLVALVIALLAYWAHRRFADQPAGAR